jgi:hypothetical protein
MPTVERKVPSTASVDDAGRAICVFCQKHLRWYINGWGYAGSGHFCNMKCAADWGDIKVIGTADGY